MSVDRIGSLSKPQLLRSALLDSLKDGSFKVGDRFPSEPELITRYGVSRATVREAIISLEQEGWLRRLQGKGTFVSERPKVHRTVAVIAPYLYANDSPDFRAGTDVIPLLMQSIEHHARKKGVSISLYLDNLEVETERENLLNVVERGVDAVLMIYIGGPANLDCLEKIRAANIPLVLFDRYIEELPIDAVASDNQLGAYRATMRLLDEGVSSVAYITGPIDSTVLRDRRQGYLDAMAERGIAASVLELRQDLGEGVDRSNYDRTYDLVRQLRFPTAIFSADATRLAVISQIVEEMGVPRSDYALGCFDEPYLNPPEDLMLVKVLQPLREIGRNAVDLTLGRIEGRSDAPARLLLPPEILVTGAWTQALIGS
ncbi:GntR family transcriptional regulator [Fimbriimonas ginsengisoli]|uniref:GntR family transcriptional regulator n=1 Tax=Fimbriimonas ginsengisoli TaxID=1005039 RepID=UPI0003E946EC|nr:GntR family transcriptional regulator [Fimbriimonas ginsengisoli]